MTARAPNEFSIASRIGTASSSVTLLLGLSVIAGCSSEAKTYPVRGLVRFPDGKVLQSGSVEFEGRIGDQAVTARGEIGPDGTFTLGTFELEDGAVPGMQRVVVISDYEIGNRIERPGLIEKTRLHAKYNNFATSGLEFEVERKENEFIIDVDYAETESEEEAASNPSD